MKRVLAILFIASSLLAHAQIPSGYYNSADGKTGDALKVALHDIIKGHHVVSYNGLLDAFAYTDCKPNGKIWDIYSNYEFSLSGNCGTYQQEGDCWNREHTWPQSWFNQSTTPRSDLFHVYPTDGFVNAQRGNYPFGEVNNPAYTSGNGSKLGPCVTQGYSGKVFEPVDEYKGDIARSYFYMSVRYTGEDDAWGTSGMTNKADIKPWAMTMLLRWSDEDPVSQKEIDRNNAVYGYQNNRNPFIDHPEYARMIWDPNWTQGASYNITCATGLQHGSVSAPESAMEGSTVAITATPEPGYMVDTYTVYKTGSSSTTVTVSSNGTFTMPGYAVTVSATFVQNSTQYQITLGSVSHGSINASTSTALSGTTVNLTATPDSGYSLYAWYVFKTGDMNTTVSVSGNSFVMPAYNVTVMATFVQGTVSGGDYVKVTNALSDWSGEYLLVYEKSATSAYVWTGTNDHDCYVEKNISQNTIADDDFVTLLIVPVTDGYSIQVKGGTNNGKYLYGTSGSNALNYETNPSVNTLSFESDGVIIVSNTSVMRYNTAERWFRYYKSTTYNNQQPIQLYKKSAPTSAPTHIIHFDNNGGTGTMNDQTVNEFAPTALNANAFTKAGYVFEGWNTEADGSGEFYADGATVSLFEDLTLYAQWYYSQQYQLVTAADQLVAGRTYLIVNIDNSKALGTTQNNNNRSAAAVSITDTVIISIDNTVVCELTLGGSTRAWTFFDAGYGTHGGYLYAASSNNNYLRTQATNNSNGQWVITIGSNGVATLQATGTNTHNLLKYNNSNDIFACYASENTQQDVCLFRRTELEDYPVEQSVSLVQGWNWWAPTVNISVGDLEQGLGGNGILINSQNSGFLRYEGGQWSGMLNALAPGQMYRIQTSDTCSFTLSGTPATDIQVNIVPGYNWFGYTGTQSLPLGSLNISPAEGDKIISQNDGFVIFNGTSWEGTLGALQPGRGYVYLSTAQETKTITFE